MTVFHNMQLFRLADLFKGSSSVGPYLDVDRYLPELLEESGHLQVDGP